MDKSPVAQQVKEAAPRHPVRFLVEAAVLGALLLVLQVALMSLPNIELVTFLVMMYALHYPKHLPYALAVFVLGEGLIYGFHTWWICYLYIWAVWGGVVYLLRKIDTAVFWAVASGIYGLLFGTLCSIPYFFLLGVGGGVSWIIAGIPFDLVHGISNFLIALLLYRPIRTLFINVAGKK